MKYLFRFDPRHGYINVGTNAIRRLAEDALIVNYYAQEQSGELPVGLFAPVSTDRGFCTNLVTANSKTNILFSLLAAKGMFNKFGMAGVASVAGVYALNVAADSQAAQGQTIFSPFSKLLHQAMGGGGGAAAAAGGAAAAAGAAAGGGWGMGGSGKREMEGPGMGMQQGGMNMPMQGGMNMPMQGGSDPMGMSNFSGQDPLNGML